jgi:hypothetical protein
VKTKLRERKRLMRLYQHAYIDKFFL